MNKQPTTTARTRLILRGSEQPLQSSLATDGRAVFPINQDGSLAPSPTWSRAIGRWALAPHFKSAAARTRHYVSFDPRAAGSGCSRSGRGPRSYLSAGCVDGKVEETIRGSRTPAPGPGPRHSPFIQPSPGHTCVTRSDSSVTAYGWNSERGGAQGVQVIPTLPATLWARIHRRNPGRASGKFVYVLTAATTHRDVSVDPASGMLAPLDWEPTQGRTATLFHLQSGPAACYTPQTWTAPHRGLGSIRQSANLTRPAGGGTAARPAP